VPSVGDRKVTKRELDKINKAILKAKSDNKKWKRSINYIGD
jgi:hypothetical protein